MSVTFYVDSAATSSNKIDRFCCTWSKKLYSFEWVRIIR